MIDVDFKINKEILFQADIFGNLKYIYSTSNEIFGKNPKDYINKNLLSYIFHGDHTTFTQAISSIHTDTSPKELNIRFCQKNGKIITSKVLLTPEKYLGNVIGIFGTIIIHDVIFEQVLHDKQKYQAMYKHIFNNINDVVLIFDKEGQVVDVNQTALHIYGYSYDEILTKNINDFKGDEHLYFNNIKKIAHRKNTREVIQYRKNGQSFPAEIKKQTLTFNNQCHNILIIRDMSEQKLYEERLRYLATYDSLTNIPNRYSLIRELDKLIKCAKKENITSTLLLIDFDNFKLVNDTYGHIVGDSVLIDAVNIIHRQLELFNIKYTLGRLNGDEFVILLKNTDVNQAKTIAEYLCRFFEKQELSLDGKKFYIRLTLSIGITLIDGTITSKRIFGCADAALYEAKHKGKNRSIVYNNKILGECIIDNNRILNLINEASSEGRFMLHYQPVCRLDGKIIHYEALIRMYDDQCRLIRPDEFIPVAEKFGLMSRIDRTVVDIAVSSLEKNKNLKVFVNLSGLSLVDSNLLDFIEQKIKNSSINPSRLGFEITETTAITDLTQAEHWIKQLKGLGSPFALDDFGFGFSSFSYLQTLPVDYLKIDGSYVLGLDNDPTKKALIQAMNAVAHTLGKKTVAECVENYNILKTLQDLDIDFAQGYYLGKPSPLLS